MSENNLPEPRTGFLGEWDKFIGPGATRQENALIWTAGIGLGALALWLATSEPVSWPWWKWVIAGVIAFDLFGGVVANASRVTKRWYHREGQTSKDHFIFTIVHILHILIVGFVFRGIDWVFMLMGSVFLILGALLILRTQAYLRRPMAYAIFTAGILLDIALGATIGLRWFFPVLLAKLLLGHLLNDRLLEEE